MHSLIDIMQADAKEAETGDKRKAAASEKKTPTPKKAKKDEKVRIWDMMPYEERSS